MRRFHFDIADSTSTRARELATQHPGKPLLVTAAEQTAGRGRQGRTWHSPRGGAWLSIVWPLRLAPPAYATVSLAAAAGVRRALEAVAPEIGPQLRIKWPNDLLLDDRKVAGILCEQFYRGGGDASHGNVLVIGVGINVDFPLAELPPDLRQSPTTLAGAVDRPVTVNDVVDAVATCIVDAMNQYEREGLSDSLLNELQELLAYVGSTRTVETPRGPATGKVLGIDDSGRLLLEGADGVIACDTGEIST